MLTDVKIKAAKPGIHWKTGKPVVTQKGQPGDYKMADAHGLYLLVTAKGGKWWRYKYYVLVGAKRVEKMGSLGTYPDVSLAEARLEHAKAKDALKGGADPVETKRKEKIVRGVERGRNRPFPEIVQVWFDDLIEPHYTGKSLLRYKYHAKILKAGIKANVDDVRKVHLAAVLLPFENAGKYETRRRIQVTALDIMEMAHDRGYIDVNHFASATFKSYTSASTTSKSRPAITDPVCFGRLLGDIDANIPQRTAVALRLLALLGLRPGELVQLQWRRDIDFKKAKLTVPWQILKQRTKRRNTDAAHRNLEVPLSRQAIAELRALEKRTGNHVHLFPSESDDNKISHMRTYILNRALNRAEYQGIHCPHGFRSTFSTMLNQERRIVEGKSVERWVRQDALIELQLDHNDASVREIYDRGGRWEDRCDLMQAWADRIDEMRGLRTKLKLAA
jgi:integrase